MKKIFTLNDPDVKKIRQSHPALKGRKLIGSGQYSGVFESDNPDTVLKLSIDEASYLFHNDAFLRPESHHFSQAVRDFGRVGTFTTSKNVTRTKLTNPVELQVPIYLYEIEKLHKIPQGTPNSLLSRRIAKDWRDGDERSQVIDYRPRAKDIVRHLRDNAFYQHDNPTVIDALEELAQFVQDYDRAFVDLHGANMMQRADGTFVFSDPIGDDRIYNAHYTFKPVTTVTTADIRRLKAEYESA